MPTETDRKALARYPFDGSDPDMILALHAAFRAGAEFAAECAPAWDEETLTNEALLLARAALAQASPSQSTPWVARLVDEVVDSTLAVVRDHLPVKPHRDALAAAIRLRHREMGSGVETVTVDDYESADAALDLWPWRSEAEVKAEALREAADWLADMDDGRDTGQHRAGRDIIARLRDRADRLGGSS